MADTKPQQRKKEEFGRLREERYQIKFIDLRFERYVKCNELYERMSEI